MAKLLPEDLTNDNGGVIDGGEPKVETVQFFPPLEPEEPASNDNPDVISPNDTPVSPKDIEPLPTPIVFTTVINGVSVTINPYLATPSGPTGQPAEFKSKYGTGPSDPIKLTFASDVVQFEINVVGPSFTGNYVIGYDIAGQEIVRVMSPFFYDPNDLNTDKTFHVKLVAPAGKPMRSVRLVPAAGDYVAYSGIVINPTVTNTPPPPPPPADEPPPPETQPAGTVYMKDVVEFSTLSLNKSYVKNSMESMGTDVFFVRNKSTNIVANVAFLGISGVKFSPASLALNPGDQKSVTVSYDVAEVNKLADGLNGVTCVFNLASPTPIIFT